MIHFINKKIFRTRLSKKAITVIMGSALLISLAVAAGSVFMKLGSAQVEDEAECAVDINLKLAILGGKDQLCFSPAQKQIQFTVENGKNMKIEGLLINTLGTKKALTSELNDAIIAKAGMYVGTIQYDQTTAGPLKQIKIIPKINLYDEEQICTEKALVIESISNC